MNRLILPKLLDIPDKLLPLVDPEVFNKYRYFIIKGGRGGGKSQSVGRLILYLNEKYNLRTVCGRETQNSISESVYSLHADLIREHQLNFDIQASRISSRATNSTINYRGFREQGAFNIQGMEGIDLVHIDEAQAISKPTLDVLIPTIRKENAKVIFTMNPHVFNDPVIATLAGRDDCLVIQINFDENPFCPAALKKEAAECLKLSEKDYKHIWLGEPMDQSEDAVFSMEDIRNGQANAHPLVNGYGIRIGGFDIARFGGDKCSDFVIQQMGALHWEEVHVDEWGERDLNFSTGKILEISTQLALDEAIVDEDGLGSGPLDTLRMGRGLEYFKGFRNLPLGFQDNKYYANVRTLNAFKLKDLLAKGHICIRDPRTIEELLTAFKYTFDHYQRRILISKDMMKSKYGIKSPNRGDAVIMAVSRIGEVKQKQDHQYESREPRYSDEGDLFNLAGIR
jgi:phage terminase large subunit